LRAASTEVVHVVRTAGPSLYTHPNNINIKKKTSITKLTRLREENMHSTTVLRLPTA
jgi:hypothetical protein